MRLTLVRHPEPVGAAGLCYGQTDLAVTSDVAEQAALRLQAVLGSPPGRCVSSPLARCRAVAIRLSEQFETDERLLELDFGSWEGRNWDDLPWGEFDYWAADYVNRRVPGGESWDDVRERARSFLVDVRQRQADTVVVTHAGVIRAMLAEVLGIPLEPTWRIQLPFGCVVSVDLGVTSQDDRLVALG